MKSYSERLAAPGPKRILAIDGGGIRGALAVGILRELESTLRARLGRPDMVLSDYFDLIGGTSTGAIIAAGLALGRDTDYLAELYHRLGPRVFKGGLPRLPLVQARFDPRRLEKVIREELGAATLGDADWKTGFAAIAKRVDTASTWILTNSPRAVYWQGDPAEIAAVPDPAQRRIRPNRDYSLSRVVQASAAAPFYFDMVPIEVVEGESGVFFDGAMTPHGNPALQLAMTALAPAYGLEWQPGADQLLIVSIGTGDPRPVRPAWVKRPRLLAIWKAVHALTSMAYDTGQFALAMLQWLGTSPQPWRINSEVGDLNDAIAGPPLWTFVRYDAPLEQAWLEKHLGEAPPPEVLKRMASLDDYRQVPALHALGARAGQVLIRPEHFPTGFDPSMAESFPSPDVVDALAPAIHEAWRSIARDQGWTPSWDMKFSDLPEEVKGANRAAARRMPENLALVGLRLAPGDAATEEEDAARNILELNMETLARAEHRGWMDYQLSCGWTFGEPRDDGAKRHDCLRPFDELRPKDQEKDRDSVRRYPDFARLAGFKVVMR